MCVVYHYPFQLVSSNELEHVRIIFGNRFLNIDHKETTVNICFFCFIATILLYYDSGEQLASVAMTELKESNLQDMPLK